MQSLRVDLHSHSTYSDGYNTPLQMWERARDIGFTHYALTDHNTVDGAIELAEIVRDTSGPELISGVELSFLQAHFLLLGVPLPRLKRQLEKWQIPPATSAFIANTSFVLDCLKWTKDQGGVVVAAHPGLLFHAFSLSLEEVYKHYSDGLIDGAERANGQLEHYLPTLLYSYWQKGLETFLTEQSIPGYAFSDAHWAHDPSLTTGDLGTPYSLVEIPDGLSLTDALLAKQVEVTRQRVR